MPWFRKFAGPLELLWSTSSATRVLYAGSPGDVLLVWRCMWAHRSQFVWFRVLFLLLSRYTLLNTVAVAQRL